MPLPSPYNGSAFTPNKVTNFIPQLWANEVRYNRDKKLSAAQCVWRYKRPAAYGSPISIPLIDDFAVYDKQTESAVTLQTQEPGLYTVTVDTQRESSVAIEDITQLFSKYNVKAIYQNRIAYALSRDIDNTVLGLRGAVPTTQWLVSSSTGTVAGDPEPIDDSIILAAMEQLQIDGVPNEDLMWLIPPQVHTQLLTIDKYLNKDYVDGRPVMTGEVGNIYGIRVVVSNNITRNSNALFVNGKGATPGPTPGVLGSFYTPTQSPLQTTIGTGLPRGKTGNEQAQPFITSMLCHKEWAIWLDPVGGMKTETSRETLMLMDAIVNHQIYGCKLYRQDHAILVHTSP